MHKKTTIPALYDVSVQEVQRLHELGVLKILDPDTQAILPMDHQYVRNLSTVLSETLFNNVIKHLNDHHGEPEDVQPTDDQTQQCKAT